MQFESFPVKSDPNAKSISTSNVKSTSPRCAKTISDKSNSKAQNKSTRKVSNDINYVSFPTYYDPIAVASVGWIDSGSNSCSAGIGSGGDSGGGGGGGCGGC